MNAWTKGPWRLHPPEITSGLGLCVGNGRSIVARIPGRRNDPNRMPDARLIATAPELAEACEALLGLAEREGWEHVAVNAARAALAKARGEA